MRNFFTCTLAVATLTAATASATPSLAGSPYYDQPDTAQVGAIGTRPVLARRIGHFTCSYNERRTRLERKNCGGARY